MKNVFKHSLAALSLLFISSAVFGGQKEGNGGDICEDRIKVIREDIASWIQKGGSKGLKLSEKASQPEYDTAMLKNISSAKISCSSDKVLVDGVEKSCKNFFDNSNTPQIICNAQRFLATNESDQYVLVHHEFAGLAGIEVTDQGDSHYEISNQISGYLEDQVVKKLVVKPHSCSPSCNPPQTSFDYNMAKQYFDNGQAPGLDALEGTWKLVGAAVGPNYQFYEDNIGRADARLNPPLGYKEEGLLSDDQSLETLTVTITTTFDGSKIGMAHAEHLGDNSHSQDSSIVALGPNGACYYTKFYGYTGWTDFLGHHFWYHFDEINSRVIHTCKLLGSDRMICVLAGEDTNLSKKIHSIKGYTRVKQ